MNETLEFCKKVLSRASFDRALFAKELKKSFLWLPRKEALELKRWAITSFGRPYAGLIASTFAAAGLG
jgi:hypothetical protein